MLSSAMHDEVPRTTILLAWRDAPTITSTLANGSSTEHRQRISYMLGMETIFPRMEMALAESTRKYKYGLRPITLAEALRKLWSKRVLRKRRAVWRKHDILNVSQHGYSAHRGIYTASQPARRRDRIRTTFTQRNMRHAQSLWLSIQESNADRAGVPRNIAQWLAEININWATIIKPNHSLNTWIKQGYARVCQPGAQASLTGAVESFSTKRRTGQEDVPYPTCWNLVLVILLTMRRKKYCIIRITQNPRPVVPQRLGLNAHGI